MSVNGTSLDRRTNKPLSDATVWEVKTPAGERIKDPKTGNPIKGNAHLAFTAAKAHRSRTGEYVVPVRV